MAEPPSDGAIPDQEFIDADEPERLIPPVNKDPAIFALGIRYMQSYGWFILFAAILLWYLSHKIRSWYRKHQERQEQSASKKYDLLMSREKHFEAQERARQKMQEQHNQQAAVFAEKQKAREELKRQEKIEDWDRHQAGGGYRSKYHPPEPNNSSSAAQKSQPKKKTPLRKQDYNPLSGDSSSNPRPERRSRTAGGGTGGG